MRSTTIRVLALCSLMACQPAERDTATDTAAAGGAIAADADAARAEIARLRDNWVAAAERDDAATVAAMYTEDAVLAVPGAEPARGREAIQQMLARDFPTQSNLRVDSRETEVQGDLAYDFGEYTAQVTPPGGSATETSGTYVVVLRRQGDGTWKLTRHVSATPQLPPAH